MIDVEYKLLHEWNVNAETAISIQNEIKKKLKIVPFNGSVELIAGVDLSFPAKDKGLAVIVLIEYPSLKLVDYVYEIVDINFPYIPGLLVFREGPAFLKTWEKLSTKPDVVIFDGQGIAHPRGIGIASHMGLFINMPTIGVAKSKLYGWYDPLPENEWSYVELKDKNNHKIGYVVRTKKGVKPIFVSPGHLTDPDSSLEIVKKVTIPGKRIPEPTRMAHILTQKLKKGSL